MAEGGTAAPRGSSAAKVPGAPPGDTTVAGARAKGLVWVDPRTNVYHTPGDAEYGATKGGKFMTEDDAKAAGARGSAQP